jgi:hypothetical protein
VDAREPFETSALGRDSPDTDKIYSIVLRDSKPLHNRFLAWPQWPGQRDISSWQGAAGIRSL